MDLFYQNASGARLYLDRVPCRMLAVTSLFDYEWSENSSSRSQRLTKSKTAKEFKLVVSGSDKAEYYANLSALLEHVESDIQNETPGRLYAGEYYLKCYLVKNIKEQKYLNIKQSVLSMSILPKADGWIKDTLWEFRYADSPLEETGKKYPYGYPYDYACGTGHEASMANHVMSDMDFIATIYGPANRPEIAFNGIPKKINYRISAGERAVINSADRTIRLIRSGSVLNLFRYRESSTIFDRVPRGSVSVYWNASFDFDLLLKEERSEPQWT